MKLTVEQALSRPHQRLWWVTRMSVNKACYLDKPLVTFVVPGKPSLPALFCAGIDMLFDNYWEARAYALKEGYGQADFWRYRWL